MALNVIVAYDVSLDDRRARLAAILGTFGVRIQRSVYSCVVDAEELEDLVDRAEQIIDLDTDVLHVSPCCATCTEQRVEMGQVNRVMEKYYWIV